ncbi:hypothetical protein VOLCADRAFT_117678 [Volvox carteri f. nagariensis]|uniref:Uncharacterized protein n=1 Tax=Volvox carteri f. nagariensis TaxID=3068 RepID=D8TWL6_VOLCA|nr:uncharacterized protein VOLCADRAFT_117678 [Volvox carteri f. nagariensis]EFJ48070.1 hypothetical protein VOLCADRAFT_117678 [Volvox carteri f. nagariensis]|eukprot:XP_002950755.1 hypothetical protein VOLCADRAFT_117678 [Volvox carteri f. nagariensis]
MEIDECVSEHVGRCRRQPTAAAAAALSGNAQPPGPHHGTQNAIIKSLLNNPFEPQLARGLQASQRPSPTVHALRFDGSGAGAVPDATPLLSTSTATHHLLPAQRSLDGGLAPQPSWGSPRSDPMCPTCDASALEVQQQLLESLADLEEELTIWAAPPKWNPSSQGRWYLYPPIGRKDVNPVEQLLETLAPSQASAVVLFAELMAGRAVRLCRELGHELAESRAEVEERTQRHADHAAQLGKAIMRLQQQLDEARRAAAAATSAAAVASAVAAAHQSNSTETTTVATTPPSQKQQHHHQQGHDGNGGGGSLRTSLTALSGSGQAAAAAAASPVVRPSSRGTTPPPAAAVAATTRTTTAAAAAAAAHASGRPGGGGAASGLHGEKKASGRPGSSAATEGGGAAAAEDEDLTTQLEQMRQLFLEAHEDSRALREALMEVDEQNMQLYEQSNGLRRHAAAVLKENDALRQEVAQLRGLLTTGATGVASLAATAAAAAATSSASTAVVATAADAAAAAAGAVPQRRGRSVHGTKSVGGGGGGGSTTESSLRASVNIPLGTKDHHPSTSAVASTTPPRPPPLSSSSAAAPTATVTAAAPPSSSAAPPPPAPGPSVGAATTSMAVFARKTDGGLTGTTVRASVRRHAGSLAGLEGAAASGGVGRDPHAPPLPPARATSSARPKSTQRSGTALSGGRPGDPTSSTPSSSLEGPVGKVAVAGSAAADRANRKTMSEALTADGALAVVHASRRPIGAIAAAASGTCYAVPPRSRSTELVPGYSNFVTDAALAKAAASGGTAKAASAGGAIGGGGVVASCEGGGGGALQYGAEAPSRPQSQAQARGLAAAGSQ